ncbi:hypothetical protein [Actinomyces viscosus]|uniref:hypothetical protein n=1 Tax=Actinomyces viscosus TaxID=1656 RepID=UPI0028EF79BD|nr:hypothetical protein [Actinomyces viscosus]
MLGYRSSFSVELDPQLGLDREKAVDALLGEGFAWMRSQKGVKSVEDLEPLHEQRFPEGDRAIYTRSRTGAGVDYAKLIYFDVPKGDEQWVTSLLVGFDTTDDRAKPTVAIEIDSPPDPRNEGKPHWTARPKLVQRILEAYSCSEHGLAIGAKPTYLREGEGVNALIEGMADPHRRSLVIVCSEDSTVDPTYWQKIMTELMVQTIGQASVYVLDKASTEEFNDRVSNGHQISPYSPRTFRPPIDPTDPQDGLRHRVLSAQKLIQSTAPYLSRMYGRLCREHANTQPIEKFLRRLDVVTARELDRATHLGNNAVEFPMSPVVPGTSTNASPTSMLGEQVKVISIESRTHVRDELQGSVTEAVEGEQLTYLINENAELRTERDRLQSAGALLRDLLQRANSSIQELERTIEDNIIDHNEAIQEMESRHKEELESQQFEWLLKDEEARSSSDKVRSLTYQLSEVRRLLIANGIDVSTSRGAPECRYVQELGQWEEIELFGRDKFPNLVFTCDWKKMMYIAERDESGAWLSQTWQSLAMLDDYCEFRRSEKGSKFVGGLREYLEGGYGGAWAISPGRYRANESDIVKGSKKYSAERNFSVPKEIDPSGKATMCSHIVIQTKGTVSPRIYFQDCIQQIGKIVIGYIGKHPRNTLTN